MPAIVALLGRPNVGKSTLFNRLVGRRQAIVDDTPGVTRDRLEGNGRLLELEFKVLDTAGMEEADPESLSGRLRSQSEAALRSADIGVFIIDAKVGVTDADEALATSLRATGKPLLLVANKAERDGGDLAVADAWRLRLGEPVAISAAHKLGMSDLADALRPLVGVAEPAPEPTTAATEPMAAAGAFDVEIEDGEDEAEALDDAADSAPPAVLQLAVVGRPNAGKSSILNRILGEERLLTGPEPGLTRDAVRLGWTFAGQEFELIDTAGLRRRSRIAPKSLEKVSTSATLEALKFAAVALLVVDATQPFERQDQTIADLVIREGRALVIALNKWDLVDEPQTLLSELRKDLDHLLAQARGVPCLPVSAVTGRGIDTLLTATIQQHERWCKRVSTGELNRWFSAMVDSQPPPMISGRRIKLRYVTQAKGRPPTFALFGNQLPKLPESYLRYLTGGLREAFDFKGVPIRWRLRVGKNPYAD